jgi:hypothetical protein
MKYIKLTSTVQDTHTCICMYIYLFVCGLFIYASGSQVTHCRMGGRQLNDKLEGNWEEAIMD